MIVPCARGLLAAVMLAAGMMLGTADADTPDPVIAKAAAAVVRASDPLELHRDVLAVDGKPVADRARFNLGDLTRTFNVPTLPLIVVHPLHAGRFKLTMRPASGRPGFGQREVRFSEQASPTLIRSTLGRDVPLRGRLVIDEASGDLLKATVEPNATGVLARIEVTFDHVDGVPMRVPVRMWKWYHKAGPITDPRVQGGRDIHNAYIDAVATYSDFRRYGVSSEEQIRAGGQIR